MATTVIQPYKNVAIHSVTSDEVRSKRLPLPGEEVIPKKAPRTYQYCDNEQVTLDVKEHKREIMFFDIPYRQQGSYINIGHPDNPKICHKTYRRYADEEIDKLFKKYNSINLMDYRFNFLLLESSFEYDNLNIEIIDVTYNEETHTASGKIIISFSTCTCPKCGRVSIGDRITDSKTQLLGVYHFNDEEHFKTTYIYKEVKTKGPLSWIRYYKNMDIFKKESCNMYRVENFNISGSKYLKDKYKKTVKNVTYKSGGTLNGNRDLRPSEREGKKIFKDSVIQYIKQKFGDEYNYTVSDVINNYNREEEFEYLHILQIKFRLGIKNTLLARLILSAKEHDPRLMSKLKGKTEKEIMTYFKVNTKMLKKIDSRNGYSCYNFLVKLFDDVNIIRTTMESMRNLSRIQNYNEPQYKDFYFHYKKHNTAKKISNQIISAQNYTVFDTQSLYAQIKSQMKDYEVDYTKGIKELHDIFSRDLAKLKRANKKIPKNKFIDKVFKNFTHDGIEYRMAKDTDELVRVGAIMDICVGGYRDRALNKDCFIVIGYKDNKPVTCIELNLHANGYRVSQVKKRKNSLAKPSENNALIELLTTHDIDANTYDLDLSYTDRRLKDEDSELLGKIERFTYARNVPEELQEEILIA